jgi:hypothetical protein
MEDPFLDTNLALVSKDKIEETETLNNKKLK